MGLAAALTTGISTFFNFGRLFEALRDVADKHVTRAAKCEDTIGRFGDGLLELGGLNAMLQELEERYSELGDEARSLPTSDRDFEMAPRNEDRRQAGLARRYHTAATPT